MEPRYLNQPYYILTLDGGGSLGVFTLGVLVEIERMLDKPLHETFDLVYGTSTGAVIASMLALGDDVENTICSRYFDTIPNIMKKWSPWRRTKALEHHAKENFGDKTFDDFLINIGIVGTDIESNSPIIFKKNVTQAHGSTASFRPGFGCTIADALVSSCAARPFFKSKKISTSVHGERNTIDGGFVANNPTFFAVVDALRSLKIEPQNIRLLSIGTGRFPRRTRVVSRILEIFTPTIITLAKASSNTVETLRDLIHDDVYILRIDETYTDNYYRSDFLEARTERLERIFQLGRKLFAAKERELRNFF